MDPRSNSIQTSPAPSRGFFMRHVGLFILTAVVVVAVLIGLYFKHNSHLNAVDSSAKTASTAGTTSPASSSQQSAQSTSAAAQGSPAAGTDNASLNSDLQSVGTSESNNQQQMTAATNAINNQSLDNPPSN